MESPLSPKGAAMRKDPDRNEAFGGPGIRFTFFWTDAGRWEGRDFEVPVLRS